MIRFEGTDQSIPAFDEIKRLKRELGEDYLYREKERLKDMTKEMIIAVENRQGCVSKD